MAADQSPHRRRNVTPTDHILLLAVCATAPRLCLGCARLYIETGVSEAANGHRSRARICVALYYLHHALAVMLAAGALFEAAHVILLSVGL